MPTTVDIAGSATNATASRLRRELERRGHHATIVPADDLGVDVGPDGPVALPYDRRPLPDVVVTAVSTEAPVALDAVRTLEDHGIPVLNRPTAVLTASNKFATAVTLREAGLPHPRTVQVTTADAVRRAGHELGWPLVLKAIDGSEGNQVALVAGPGAVHRAIGAVRASLGLAADRPAPLLAQQPVDAPLGRDRRVVVAGGVAIAAMDRQARPGEWRSNLSQGAQPVEARATPDEEATAIAAVRALGLDLGLVDLVPTAEGPVVIEVNSFGDVVDVAAFSEVDVVSAIADLAEAIAGGRRDLTPESRRLLAPDVLVAELAFCRERLARKAVELAERATAAAT